MVTVQVTDTVVSPFDSLWAVSVYMKHEVLDLGGLDIWCLLGRPDLMTPPESLVIDTILVPPDTTVYTEIDLTGSMVSGWATHNLARVYYPTAIRIIRTYDPGNPSTAIPPSDTMQFLFRAWLKPLLPLSVLDTLRDRRVRVIPTNMGFSTPTGTTIGLRDSLLCLNPPVCDSLDTVFHSVNVGIEGSVFIDWVCPPGDVNEDGSITSADVIGLVNHVFKGAPEPGCQGVAGDFDCSRAINSADIVKLVNFVFKGGPGACGY